MSDADRRAAARANAAAPNTVAGLYASLAARMEDVAEKFSGMLTKSGDRRAATIIPGWSPPKTPEGELFPFIVLRPRSGEDSPQGADESARAQIRIIVGTFCDEDDGWIDVLSLVDAIRDDLNAQPAIVGTAYEHVGPLTWEIPEEQPRPQWIGFVTTNWQLPRAQRVDALNP
jgi:hypothetical protein